MTVARDRGMASEIDARQKLQEILTAAHDVVLLTHGEDHRIVGRPMHRVRTDADGTTYLVTGIISKKVAELDEDPRVALAIQDRKGFAMIDAEVEISQDRALVDQLWNESWKAWFAGKDDPEIAILIAHPREATYWDASLGHGISYLWRAAKAAVTGGELERAPGDEEHVELRH